MHLQNKKSWPAERFKFATKIDAHRITCKAFDVFMVDQFVDQFIVILEADYSRSKPFAIKGKYIA